MPFMFNGIGTTLSGNVAPISWQKKSFFGLLGQQADHDAVECFVVFYVPIVPLRAYHTYGWNGNRYRSLPIRRTPALLLSVYARPALFVLFGLGIAVALFALWMTVTERDPVHLVYAVPAAMLAAAAWGGMLLLRRTYTRTRDVRLVLGPHDGGSSDPALWTADLLGRLAVADHVSQSRSALQRASFAEAMLHARLAVARGMAEGEMLTDEILAHPMIQAALPDLRREPWRRTELLNPQRAATAYRAIG